MGKVEQKSDQVFVYSDEYTDIGRRVTAVGATGPWFVRRGEGYSEAYEDLNKAIRAAVDAVDNETQERKDRIALVTKAVAEYKRETAHRSP